MANNPILYRVLWVDEETDPIGFISLARKYDLLVYRYSSWQEAKEILQHRFEAFSAIVLDGNCVINKGESPTPDFLYQAVREMEAIFVQHEETLPWYVLSSGTGEDFNRTIQRISMGDRSLKTEQWGTLYHSKSGDLTQLCESIRKTASHRNEYKIVRLYRPVFDTLKRYFDAQSANTMLDILLALHFPETRRSFDPVLYYTQLRRILEYLFRAANQQGILPDAMLGEQGKVNLSNSSLYLSGREVTINRTNTYRYGKPGESFFSPIMAQLVKSILVVANKNSHSTELDSNEASAIRDYNRTTQSNNLLFGYALHLCDVIVYFGQKVDELHNNSTYNPRVQNNTSEKKDHPDNSELSTKQSQYYHTNRKYHGHSKNKNNDNAK